MMRFLLPAALAVVLLVGFVAAEAGGPWSDHAPTLALLVVIILLLWRQQSQRDFYVVRHLGYDLAFKEHPGVTYVTADQEWHGHAVSHVTVRAALARSHAMIAQLHQDTRG